MKEEALSELMDDFKSDVAIFLEQLERSGSRIKDDGDLEAHVDELAERLIESVRSY